MDVKTIQYCLSCLQRCTAFQRKNLRRLDLRQFKRQLEVLSRQGGHPKLMALKGAVLEHFGVAQGGNGGGGATMVAGRIIVFTSLRESVAEIIAMLQKHEPFVKARCLRTPYI
jgi:ERCC4-related helicase